MRFRFDGTKTPADTTCAQDLNDQGSTRWAIAPVLLLAIVVDVLSAAAVFRIPLKVVSPFLFWALIAAAAVLFVRGALSFIPRRLVLATLLVAMVSVPALRRNWSPCAISDSVVPVGDAWSYSAFGKYLWENSRGIDTGLSLSDEYASSLRDTRFAASGLLGFLSLFSRPGDPASAMILFILVCYLGMFSALFYFCRALGFSIDSSIAAGFLGVFTGWLSDAVMVGNLDNLLFVPLFTAFLGSLAAAARSGKDLSEHAVTLVACGSAAIYCYPEGFLVGAVLAFPIILWGLAQAFRQQLKRTIVVALVTAGIVSPYLHIAYVFLQSQFAISHAAIRPGEGFFRGLLRPAALLPAAYALGEEYQHADVAWWNWLLPIILSALISIGIWRLRRRAGFFVLSLAPFAMLCIWQGRALYGYGLYKVLLIASFLTIPLMACGLSAAVARIGRVRGIALAAGTALVILLCALEREEDHPNAIWAGKGCMTQVRDLASLRFLSPQKAVVVDIPDDFLQPWAIYYMRDVNTILPSPAGYLAMPHIKPYLARAKSATALPAIGRLNVGFVQEAIWSDGVFSITPADKPAVTNLSNPNGVEFLDGAQFVWVGPDPLSVKVIVPRDGRYLIRAERFMPGPSLPEKRSRSIKIEQGSTSFTIEVGPDTTSIPVELSKGENTINISCLDRPTVARLSNGDIRPLLLGIRRLFLSPEEPESK